MTKGKKAPVGGQILNFSVVFVEMIYVGYTCTCITMY